MTSTSTPHTMALTNPRPKLLAALRKPIEVSSDSSSASENEVSDFESNEPIFRTRPQPQQSPTPDAENEDSDGGGAYERMKKRLASAKSGEEPQNAQRVQAEAINPATLIISDEEDEVPVRSHARRSLVRTEKIANLPPSPTTIARSRQSSPGLFITPNASPTKSRTAATVSAGSDESMRDTSSSADLQERIRRIRAERLARKEDEQASKDSRGHVQRDSGSDTDDESGRRLTQQAKPTRRAGKKALEAIARDQQRISRNMQLTHQSKTKKRFGVKDICSRWGVTALNVEAPVVGSGLPTPDPSSALVSSDAEANNVHKTPPISPPRLEGPNKKGTEDDSMAICRSTSPPQKDTFPPPPVRADKGKGRAPEFQHLPPHPWMKKVEPMPVQHAQGVQKQMVELSDSDDDLQIVEPKSRFPVFDRLPLSKQQQSSSMLHLRHLAHLTSPKTSRKGPKSISLTEMQISLAQKARQQALKEREEKIAELKRRGIHIATEEEREKDQQEIEDMVAQFEKQRQEDLKLAKTEREEAKKNGETVDGLPSSDEDDADYVGSGEENSNEMEAEVEDEEGVELILSGSEDEAMEEDPEDDELADEANGLIDEMAHGKEEAESTTQEQHVEEDADMEDEGLEVQVRRRTNIRPRNRVVVDEDDVDNEVADHASPTQQATQNDAMAAFGFGNSNGGLGLTQMFAGTMANMDSESQPTSTVIHEPEQDSLDFLRGLPDTQPAANFSQASDFMVPNSQSMMTPQKESQMGEDSQFSLGISQLMKTSPAFSRTQLEDLPEPTQDAGFSFSRSPAGFMPPPSTVDTVMLSIAESPIKQKKGKLQRGRREAAIELSDVEEDLVEAEFEAETSEDDIQLPPKPSRDAFAKMQKAAQRQKAINEFNKKTSLAKSAVMEQAEESEDEYAGLGGASDDDSGEEDEETKNMIEHGEVDVDEREIAAFFA
jgi:mediator of replication checkpoint protein 1